MTFQTSKNIQPGATIPVRNKINNMVADLDSDNCVLTFDTPISSNIARNAIIEFSFTMNHGLSLSEQSFDGIACQMQTSTQIGVEEENRKQYDKFELNILGY